MAMASSSTPSSPMPLREVHPNYHPYPPTLATYQDVVASPQLFMDTLQKLHISMGTKFMYVLLIPVNFFSSCLNFPYFLTFLMLSREAVTFFNIELSIVFIFLDSVIASHESFCYLDCLSCLKLYFSIFLCLNKHILLYILHIKHILLIYV